MAAETVTERREWDRWRGSPADIVRIAQRMEELLRAAGIERNDVSITVDRKNTKTSYSSAAEAADQLPTAALTNLNEIVLFGGTLGDLSMAVYFLKRATVLRVEGTGNQHIKVAGIADDLAADLDRGGHSLPHKAWIYGGLLIALWALLGGSIATDGALAMGLSLAALVPALAILWLFAIRPIFMAREIVAEGQLSRVERWRGFLLRFGAWALTLLVGAVLGVLFTKWFG